MKTRLTRWLTLAVLLAVGIYLSAESFKVHAQSSDASKPLAIVTLAGYDELIKDINFLGGLAGQPQAAQQLEMMVQMFTQGKGLAGLDKSRPIGVLVLSDGAGFQGAACLPVTSLDELLGALAGLGIQAEDQGDGVKKITGPNGELFVREQGDWAFVAPMQELLDGLPNDPGEFFAPLAKEYDIAARVFVQNVPEQFRQMAMPMITQSMESSLEQLPDENDEAYELRKSVAKAQLVELTRMLDEKEVLTRGLPIHREEQRVPADFSFT